MFGRKKRRQEPISAVAPETHPDAAWQPDQVNDGEVLGVGEAGDRGRFGAGVSRETRSTEDSADDGLAAGLVDKSWWSPPDEISGDGAEVGHAEAADPVSAAFGTDDRTVGGNGQARDDIAHAADARMSTGVSTDDTDDLGRGDERLQSGGIHAAGRGSAGLDGAGLDGAGLDGAVQDDAGQDDEFPSATRPEGAGAGGSSPTAPASLSILSLDEADSTHGAFSSAPRPQPSRPVVPIVSGAVSRETHGVVAVASSIDGAKPGSDVESPGDASAQPERTGENEDVPSHPLQALGVVHDDEARRAALVDSLPDADDDTPLMAQIQADARRRIQLRGRRFPRPAQTRIITVANQKGGVGKTTTTVNLAAALAQSGLNVLVLDNDPQGNASTALGVAHHAGTPSIYEVLVDEAPMAGAVQECPDVPNLWCVPATIDLSGAEIELVSMVARETRLRTALDAYLSGRIAAGQEPIDYVFVDCPPSLGLLTINAFVVGREVLIPIQCEYYALEGLTQLLKTIQLIQAHLNPELHVSTILLTMYDARTNLAQQVAQEVRDHFPETTLRTSVPRSVRISEAPSYGQTVITYDAGSSGALAYLEAARELAERGAAGSDAKSDVDEATSSSGDGHATNHTNGTPDGSSSVVGSSAGTHQEEQ